MQPGFVVYTWAGAVALTGEWEHVASSGGWWLVSNAGPTTTSADRYKWVRGLKDAEVELAQLREVGTALAPAICRGDFVRAYFVPTEHNAICAPIPVTKAEYEDAPTEAFCKVQQVITVRGCTKLRPVLLNSAGQQVAIVTED